MNTLSDTLILGIETSCDETAVAIIDGHKKIYANKIASQIDIHKEYGGVVPEIAARAHLEKLMFLVDDALQHAGLTLENIHAFAATTGPGLIGGVIVGMMFAKSLAQSLNKPFIAVNHLEAHALTVRLTHDVPFPYLMLLASGGHCQFLWVEDVGQYQLLGQTIDDAAGEAFDKVAKMMDIPYPGGPNIEKLAQRGNPDAYAFPRPLKGRNGCDLSFSGLKTAVKNTLDKLDHYKKEDIAASFQQAITDCLVDRAKNAFHCAPQHFNHFVLAGGVAANQTIFHALKELFQAHNVTVVAPPIALCTDNAAMVAWAGFERLRKGYTTDLTVEARPRWPLEELKK